MATSEFSASSNIGSDFLYDFCCTPCSKDNAITEAIKQCVDCNEYFCAKCLDFHNKLGATSGHQILDKDKMTKMSGSKTQDPLPRERCQDHHGERLTTFCADHDVVCCNTCVAVSHRNCESIIYILKAAQGIKSSKELHAVKADTVTTLTGIKQRKADCQNHMTLLDDDRTKNIKKVRNFTEGLVSHIKDLETTAIDQIQSRYKDIHDNVQGQVKSLDDMISSVEEIFQKLDHCQQNQESQVFVDAKLGKKHVAEVSKGLHETGSMDKPSIRYVIKSDLEYYLVHLDCLGTFIDDKKGYKTGLNGEYDVKTSQDETTCNLVGSCVLPDRAIVLTDWNNNCIKRLNTVFDVIGRCYMSSKPWGVACTGPAEVVVTMTDQKTVQFVSIGEYMSLTRSFSTNDYCRGICFSNGKLFVSCGGMTKKGFEEGPGHVAVYSLTGAHLRTIQTHHSGEQIFSMPMHITASIDDTRIYVTQQPGGVVALYKNGILQFSFNDIGLKNAKGLCTLANGHFLLCGSQTNNVFQVDSDGKKVTELLKKADGLNYPQAISYDSAGSRVIITMGKCNTIKVFDLKQIK